jgi:cytochrome c biogenesis protein CcmG/thiol:disulfide interchange protein DsbE
MAVALTALLLAVPASIASKAARPELGLPAPDFTLSPLAGKGEATSLKSLEGQVVLLDFWASWCAPCKRTLPEIARMGSRHKGLKVLAVSLDEDRRKAVVFLKDGAGDMKGAGMDMDALHDAKQEVAARYDLAGMPAAVLIDRKGVLRARYDGYTERDLKRMEAEARKLLEEKP